MAGEDPACGSNPGDINMQATHVDAIVEAPSDGGSIPPASTSFYLAALKARGDVMTTFP